MYCSYCGNNKDVLHKCEQCGRKEASYCIGDYGGVLVDANEKKDIETQIGLFYPDSSIKQMLAFCMIAVGTAFFFLMFWFMPQFIMWVFLILSLAFLVGGIFLWALGGCIPYASWKRAVKYIRKHDLYKIQVQPLDYIEHQGFYKEKYVSFEIEGDMFAEYFSVKDDVYDNQDKIELWAYYLKYTEKERRNNQHLKRYGIFIVGKESMKSSPALK